MRTIQIDRLFGASLLTQSAENTTQHIDLVNRGIFFFPVQKLLTFLALSSDHRNRFGRTGQSTQATSCTPLPSLLVSLQRMLSPKIFRIRAYLFRIFDRRDLLKKMSYGNRKPLSNGRQVHALPYIHRLLLEYLFSIA